MNIYHAWCDLKPGVSDIAFSEGASKYLTHLQAKGMIESWQITRRKLGSRRSRDRVRSRMSAFGTKQTSHERPSMSAFGGKADIVRCYRRISSSWHNPYKD